MNPAEIVKEILGLLRTCKDIEITDFNSSLFSKELDYTAADVTYVLIKLNQVYHFSMEKLIRRIKCFSVNEIADNISCIIEVEAES